MALGQFQCGRQTSLAVSSLDSLSTAQFPKRMPGAFFFALHSRTRLSFVYKHLSKIASHVNRLKTDLSSFPLNCCMLSVTQNELSTHFVFSPLMAKPVFCVLLYFLELWRLSQTNICMMDGPP